MKYDKAPGPDGYTAEFFVQNWDIIGEEVTNALKFCFDRKYMFFPLNSTAITLIHKSENARSMKYYRPISCCNLIYTCYSYVLTSRLKQAIHGFLSLKQNAFVKGRQITENVLLMHDLVRGYHRQGGKPRAVIKVDIMKAYDSLNWDFLFNAMSILEFPQRFIDWVYNGVTTAHFSLNINGSLVDYFHGERGLRGGDPISPYLFLFSPGSIFNVV